MTSYEILGIYALLVLNLVATLGLARFLSDLIVQQLAELDTALGGAVSQLGQVTIEPGEGMNPIQLAIAQYISAFANQRASTIAAEIIPRDDAGMFASPPQSE